jgi:RecA/RadA recombinase
MARQKKNVEDTDGGVAIAETREDIQKRIAKDIEKNFGKGVMVSGTDIIDRPRMLIPVSPAINQITGGGIPEGSWVILSGKEKIGKTIMALHFAKRCQKPEYGSRNIYFLNVEGRLKKRDLLGNVGLDPSKITIIESTEDKILTAEDYLQTASNILYNDKRCVLIIDSISQLCEQRVQTGGVGTQTRGSGGILVSQFTSQMGPVVNVKNSIIICILQHRNNTSGYGGNLEKGGWAIQYQVDVKLIAQGGPSLLPAPDAPDPYGHIVTWKCTATGVNFPPNRKCEGYIRYGEGIDEATELIVDAKDMGLITGETWMTLDFLKDHKEEIGIADKEWDDKTIKELGAMNQGKEKTRQALKNNPLWMELLQKDILKML